MTETLELKMPSKKMLLVLFLQYGVSWLIITLAGVIILCGLGAIIDIRFFMLALIWIFLFIPLIIAFLYFYYGMKPLTVFNSIPHKIGFTDTDMKIRIPINEEEKEEGKEYKEYDIKKDKISEIKHGADYVLLISKKEGLLWLPQNAFDSFDQFKNTIKSFTAANI